MNTRKGLLIGATAFGLTLSVAGISSVAAADAPATAVSGIHSSTANQEAAENLNHIYDHAFIGEMPGKDHTLTINKSTKEDIHEKLGTPEKVEGRFNLYHWEMGNPGYGFAYNEDDTVSEIRYFGTGVERDQNLEGITPAILDEQLGQADEIYTVPGTNETDYVYNTDEYELHFVVGSDQTVDYVNLKEAE